MHGPEMVRAREQSRWGPCAVTARLTALGIFFLNLILRWGDWSINFHMRYWKEMAQQLGAFTTLAEYLGSIPNAHVVTHSCL